MAPSRSIEPAPPLNAEDRVLWDVVEEHLDEAEFCFELFESQLDHPTLSLAELARGTEARLLAHIDALVIGGSPVAERLLAPQIADADPARPARTTATALALLAARQRDALLPALFHEDHALRSATVRACALWADPELDRWVVTRSSSARREQELQPLLELLAQRALEPPNLLASLQSSDSALVASAARAARFGDPRLYLACVEDLLTHPESRVRQAALITALAANSTRARRTGEQWALDEQTPHPEAMTLYACLTEPPQHALLARHLASAQHRPHALFALGFTGNPTLVPMLLDTLHNGKLREAKLAAQAISTITGLDLERDEFIEENASDADEALPSLVDDLAADLALMPEDALPRPNGTAIERFWHSVASEFRADVRYLGGIPFTSGSVLQYLEGAPLRRRHALGATCSIAPTGVARLDTRAFSATQRVQLASLRRSLHG